LVHIFDFNRYVEGKLNEAAFSAIIYEIGKDFFIPNRQYRINKRKNTKREIIKKAYLQ
jgi:hypothetical protein